MAALGIVFWRNQATTGDEPVPAGIDQSATHTSPAGEPQDPADSARDPATDESGDIEAEESGASHSESDMEAQLEWLREETTKDVLTAYALIYEHLGLSESERNDLTLFLVEVWMSGTRMRNYHPQPIEESDRQAGIAAIIGDARLQQLLVLEQNRAEYTETSRVAGLLQANDAPLTAAQQDQLLDILIRVRETKQPVAYPEPGEWTIETIERRMAAMDEYERLVLELAPSVLTARQVELLFERYQAFSYQREATLEKQKKSRANDTEEDDLPLMYPPRY